MAAQHKRFPTSVDLRIGFVLLVVNGAELMYRAYLPGNPGNVCIIGLDSQTDRMYSGFLFPGDSQNGTIVMCFQKHSLWTEHLKKHVTVLNAKHIRHNFHYRPSSSLASIFRPELFVDLGGLDVCKIREVIKENYS